MTSRIPVGNGTTLVGDVMESYTTSPVTCLPVVVVSRKYVYSAVGDLLEIDCHVVGRSSSSEARVFWVLPGGKVRLPTPVHR